MKRVVLIVLLCASLISHAQNEEIDFYDYFDLYSDWGFSASVVSYREPFFERNEITEIVGDNYKGIQLGARYHYKKNREWSFNMGLLFNYMMPSKMYFTLDNNTLNNIQANFNSELKGKFYLQLPVSAEIKKRLGYNVHFNFNMGFTFSYFNEDDHRITFEDENSNTLETNEVFTMDYNDGSLIHVNTLFESGIYWMFKGFMIKTNIIYNKAFENTYTGNYRFKNLSDNESVDREFKTSGDYFGFSTTIYFTRKN